MAVSCPQILWWPLTSWDLQELLYTPVWKPLSTPLTNTREKGFVFRMSIRPLWLREGKWKRPAPVRRHVAAPARVLILLRPIRTAKRRLQRHCSQAIPLTAITQRPSSSSRTEQHRNGRNVTCDPLRRPVALSVGLRQCFVLLQKVSHWSHWNLPLREFFQENPLVILVQKRWTENVTVKKAHVILFSDLVWCQQDCSWKSKDTWKCNQRLGGFELLTEWVAGFSDVCQPELLLWWWHLLLRLVDNVGF